MSTYLALNHPRQVRVIHLAPGRREDALSGTLEHVQLGEVSYEALSYVWGQPDRVCDFHLDSGSIPITSSLRDALLDLRRETTIRTIWADGICINQDDLDERAQQVTMMGKIYRTARRVVTYVGPEEDDSSLAIAFATDLVRYAMMRYINPDPRIHVAEELPNIGLPPITNPRWGALRKLLVRTWVTRCWCSQEFLLNQNLTLMCGRSEIRDWELLSKLARLVFSRHLPSHLLPTSRDDPLAIGECLFHLGQIRLNIFTRGAHFNLSFLLRVFHPFQASDPRDKIYSILGLAADRKALQLKVDYTQTTEELYISVASKILTVHPDINLLAHNLGSKKLTLPSWVPDWSTWIFGTEYVNRDWNYSAAGRTKPQILVRGKTIDVSGCLVDQITSLSSPIGPHYFKNAPNNDRVQWLSEQAEFIRPLEPYPGEPDLTNVLWRTLIGDLSFDERPASGSYRTFFEAHSNCNDEMPVKEKDMARQFIDAVRRKSRSRVLATTGRGYLGAVPVTSRVGDWICMFHGSRNLFIVRQELDGFCYVGTAYVHGLMQGEALEADWYHGQLISIV